MDHLKTRFAAAAEICVGAPAVKDRLVTAWLEQLDSIDSAELPRSLRNPFRELRRAMYGQTPMPHEAAPVAAVRKMSADEAAGHAATILRLATELGEISANSTITAARDRHPRHESSTTVSVPERLN